MFVTTPSHNNDDDKGQVLRAVCDIAPGEEITISYLPLPFLYAETRTRQQQLRWTKHLECHCEQCSRRGTDIVGAIPVPHVTLD